MFLYLFPRFCKLVNILICSYGTVRTLTVSFPSQNRTQSRFTYEVLRSSRTVKVFITHEQITKEHIFTYSQYPALVNRSPPCKRIYYRQHGTIHRQWKFPSCTLSNRNTRREKPFLLPVEPSWLARYPRHNRSTSSRNACERNNLSVIRWYNLYAVVKLLRQQVTRKYNRISSAYIRRNKPLVNVEREANTVDLPVEVFGTVEFPFTRVAFLRELEFTFVALKTFCMPHTVQNFQQVFVGNRKITSRTLNHISVLWLCLRARLRRDVYRVSVCESSFFCPRCKWSSLFLQIYAHRTLNSFILRDRWDLRLSSSCRPHKNSE